MTGRTHESAVSATAGTSCRLEVRTCRAPSSRRYDSHIVTSRQGSGSGPQTSTMKDYGSGWQVSQTQSYREKKTRGTKSRCQFTYMYKTAHVIRETSTSI